jgi:hypothetical protein
MLTGQDNDGLGTRPELELSLIEVRVFLELDPKDGQPKRGFPDHLYICSVGYQLPFEV